MSPDPLTFRSTIWLEHDQKASARAHEEPIEQLRDRVRAMEHTLETLRTRLTQVADLRDAQGIREIRGRLPTATQLHQSFIKILSKHLAANKKVNLVFQQQSSTIPMMNPSPTEIVELFSFVEVTLIQYATVAGHFPGVVASSVKPKPKKANKVEVTSDEPIYIYILYQGRSADQRNNTYHTSTKTEGTTKRELSE